MIPSGIQNIHILPVYVTNNNLLQILDYYNNISTHTFDTASVLHET